MLAYLAQGKNLRAEISLLFLARTHAEMLGGGILLFWQSQELLGGKTDPICAGARSHGGTEGEVTKGSAGPDSN